MGTTTQVTDFVDLYTDLQNKVRAATSVTATENQAKRYINTALQDIHIGFGEKFAWAERAEVLRTRATYSTGTLTATVGSTTLTGASTLWNTNDDFGITNMRVGGKIVIDGGTDIYGIASVSGDTAAVMDTAWIGTTASLLTYIYFEDEYTLHTDFLRPIDFQRFSSAAQIDLISRTEFRRRFPRNHLTGKPVIACLFDESSGSDTVINRRVRFFRAPDQAYLIPYAFVTNKLVVSSSGTLQTSFSADADEPIVPLQYRHVIVLHALFNWYRDKKDDQRSLEVKGEYNELMSRIVGDTEIGAPRPQITPRVSNYASRARNPWGGGSRRHVTGSRFDEIR